MSPVEPGSRRLFGVSVRSEIPLPLGAAVHDPADVLIAYGAVPGAIENPRSEGVCFMARPDALLLSVGGVARYFVEGGARVTVERAAGSTEDEVRLFLLSSAFAALVHQRRMLPLNGTAIVAGGDAVVFAGAPALGKTTLAAGLLGKGYALLSDDLCAVSLDAAGRPVVHPGLPQVKLWANSLRELGHDAGALRPVRPGVAKYLMPVQERFHGEAARLRSIYILKETTDTGFSVERIAGFDATVAVNGITYRPAFLGGPHPPTRDDLRGEPWASHLERVMAIAARCSLTEVTRPSRGFRLEELAALIEADFNAGRAGQ